MAHDMIPMVDAVKTGASYQNIEVIILGPNKTEITVLVNISPICNQEGKIIGAINAFQDITQQVADRKRLARQQENEKAMALLDTFISFCSHELKTPLTSLKFQAQIAKR